MEPEDNERQPQQVDILPESEGFKLFLSRLDAHEETASKEYLDLHARLAKSFEWKLPGKDGLALADLTIGRVVHQLQDPEYEHIQDIKRYCFGVARNIVREKLRAPQIMPLDPTQPPKPIIDPPTPWTDLMDKFLNECTKHCIQKETEKDRDLFFKYFFTMPSAEEREALAITLKMTGVNLRQTASRIKRRIQACVEECKRKGKT